MTSIEDVFVTPEWLNTKLGSPKLRVIDGSWYMPALNRNTQSEFQAEHIPSAVFFDQDKIVDPTGIFPHTVPSAAVFAQAVGELGIQIDDEIVIYETGSLFSAPRIWWMFHIMGAKNIRILKGGLPAWKQAGFATETGAAHPEPVKFNATLDADKLVTIDELVLLCKAGDVQIADARSAARFTGSVAEPRAGVRSGSIPSSVNVPFDSLVEDGAFKSLAAIKEIFAAQDIKGEKPIITTCGSGVTAAVLFLALTLLGYQNIRLYDGSWTEWGSLT